MDMAFVIRHRLKELGLEQRDLAAAAQVTKSYIFSYLEARSRLQHLAAQTSMKG